MTKAFNHALYFVFLLAAVSNALPAGSLDIFPVKWRPVVAGILGAACWVKGHRNLFVNPDGTAAETAWVRHE